MKILEQIYQQNKAKEVSGKDVCGILSKLSKNMIEYEEKANKILKWYS